MRLAVALFVVGRHLISHGHYVVVGGDPMQVALVVERLFAGLFELQLRGILGLGSCRIGRCDTSLRGRTFLLDEASQLLDSNLLVKLVLPGFKFLHRP